MTVESPAPRSRRSFIAAAAAGVAGLVATAFSRPQTAEGAAGDPLLIGNTSNNAGTSNTTLTTNSSGTALLVTQNGTGTALRGSAVGAGSIAGFFTANNGTGISGVTGNNASYGVFGQNNGASSTSGGAMRASGGATHGVVATSSNSSAYAVKAQNTGTGGNGVWGEATAIAASSASDVTGRGVVGVAHGDGAVVFIFPVYSAGVYGTNDFDGGSITAAGVYGEIFDDSGQALRGISWGNGKAVWGSAIGATGLAGHFSGDVQIDGDLAVSGTVSKGGGSFRIDHPLDAANKYLYHSFVESSEMLNVYSGNVTTDAAGHATVPLPAWFGAVNKELRYQLTTVGQQAQAWIASEVKDGAFAIATDKPNVKVSWELTGVRQDAWANANRVQVEVDKAATDRGKYLHPEAIGKAASLGIGYDPLRSLSKADVETLLKERRAAAAANGL